MWSLGELLALRWRDVDLGSGRLRAADAKTAAGVRDVHLNRAAKGHPGHRHVRRRAMLAALTFAGLRLGELLALRWRDVDLGSGRLRVADAKTAAGVRDVHLLPVLRDELLALKASGNPRAEALVFPTTSGKQIGASNLRRRVLAPAIELANARLSDAGEPPLPAGLTPAGFRMRRAERLSIRLVPVGAAHVIDRAAGEPAHVEGVEYDLGPEPFVVLGEAIDRVLIAG